MPKKDITQARLKELLNYDPKTGVFTWKKNRAGVRSGSTAGCIDTASNSGYVRIGLDSTVHQAHRLAWLYVYGCFPEQQLDHINRDRSDNRIENLRQVTNTINQWNRAKNRNSASGHQGVSLHKLTKKWQAKISANGRTMHLGLFDTPEAAHAAYIAAKKEYHQIESESGALSPISQITRT